MAIDLNGFNPNTVGLKSNNIFGLPFKEDEAELVLLPVPWEVTVSYRPGAARGPEHIFSDASMQVDLFDPDVKDGWKKGFYMLPVDKNIRKKSDYLRQCAELIIGNLVEGGKVEENEQLACKMREVNEGGRMLYSWVKEMTSRLLKEGKKVGLIGGDHSTPLGFVAALADIHPEFGILQIDAHADLRIAFEGFEYSHASIMYNILKQIPQVTKLVQVGIRDYCDEELYMGRDSDGRIVTFFDKDLKEQLYEGKTWKQECEEIIATLPQKVYISFDIDGLDPKLCPNTGTPVPGGFEVDQIMYLFKKVADSGREIIGFDLNEVSSGEHSEGIDAIVGARVLYKMCNLITSQKRK